jgi:hypothetical protein
MLTHTLPSVGVDLSTTVAETGDDLSNITHKNEWLLGISIALLGLTGIIILAMIGDYYSPDMVRSVPYAENVLDSIYGFMQSIYN